MDHFSRISIFISVVKHRSFAGAARELGITGSAISKQIINLENQLGVRLLHRTTRTLTLTEEGTMYYECAARALGDLQEAEYQIHELRQKPTGLLKVNAPMSFGKKHLVGPIAAFAKAYPEVIVEAEFDDRIVDVIGEGLDVVIRIAAHNDSTLISRKLTTCPILLCASPGYLKQYGTPDDVTQLAAHRHIVFSRHGMAAEWRYQHHSGTTGVVYFNAVFRANNAEMMLEAALQEIGIAVLPIFMAAPFLKSGQLVQLLPDYITYPERTVYALFPSNRYVSTKVKLFIDYISNACKALPW